MSREEARVDHKKTLKSLHGDANLAWIRSHESNPKNEKKLHSIEFRNPFKMEINGVNGGAMHTSTDIGPRELDDFCAHGELLFGRPVPDAKACGERGASGAG